MSISVQAGEPVILKSTASRVAHRPSSPAVGYILRSYPRLSQTFILHEILALEQLGMKLAIFALTNPREPVVQPEVAEVRAPVHYLEAGEGRRLALLAGHLSLMLTAPRRYFKSLWYVLSRRELDAGYAAGSRYQCFAQAVELAGVLKRRSRHAGSAIGHLHAHFAHDPTLVALLAHMLTGISFSFTAHARDLYQVPVPLLVERVEKASAVVTCCAANVDYLKSVLPKVNGKQKLQEKIRLIYHGVDLQEFRPAGECDSAQAHMPGSGGSAVPLIVSAGRLVEKKGYLDLLEACRLLKQEGYRFKCAIYGEGPMREELLAAIERLGIANEVALPGPVAQRELVPVLQGADVFALTPFVTADGDRDGVPNVLVEAMACGLPVVSTRVAGVGELVTHGKNGLLVEPHDVRGIADGLAALLADELKRRELGEAARRRVAKHFDLRAAAGELRALLDSALEGRLCAAPR